MLGKSVRDIPGVKFFVTSKPETHIMTGFRGPSLRESTYVFILHEVEPRAVDKDIRHFLKRKLSELSSTWCYLRMANG